MKKVFVVMLLVSLVSACSWLPGKHQWVQNRSTDYLSAKPIAPLKIPANLSSAKIKPSYTIPPNQYPLVTKTVDLTPPGL